MPQLTPIVLTDGAATPVNHTFNPREITGGVATLVESTGVPLGERRLTLSQNRSASGRVKPIAKLVFPVIQDAVINGITKPTVVRQSYVDLTFNFDGASSLQERKDVVAMVRSLLDPAKADVQKFLIDLEGLY